MHLYAPASLSNDPFCRTVLVQDALNFDADPDEELPSVPGAVKALHPESLYAAPLLLEVMKEPHTDVLLQVGANLQLYYQ